MALHIRYVHQIAHSRWWWAYLRPLAGQGRRRASGPRPACPRQPASNKRTYNALERHSVGQIRRHFSVKRGPSLDTVMPDGPRTDLTTLPLNAGTVRSWHKAASCSQSSAYMKIWGSWLLAVGTVGSGTYFVLPEGECDAAGDSGHLPHTRQTP